MASAPSVRHDRPLSVRQLRRTAADPAPPEGADACVFAARCPFAVGACAEQPSLERVADRWTAACRRHEEWIPLARARKPAHK
jgi:hypothetical protein